MNKEERFIILKARNDRRMTYTTEIIVDLATGVQYLMATSGQGTGLTPLLDPQGKPLLYRDPDPYFQK